MNTVAALRARVNARSQSPAAARPFVVKNAACALCNGPLVCRPGGFPVCRAGNHRVKLDGGGK